MAIFPKLETKPVAAADMIDSLSHQIASLGKELASIKVAINRYSENSLDEVQHSAVALAREVRHGSRLVARNVSRQAHIAGKVAQDNPVPVLVGLGTLALLSVLFLSRD